MSDKKVLLRNLYEMTLRCFYWPTAKDTCWARERYFSLAKDFAKVTVASPAFGMACVPAKDGECFSWASRKILFFVKNGCFGMKEYSTTLIILYNPASTESGLALVMWHTQANWRYSRNCAVVARLSCRRFRRHVTNGVWTLCA